MMYVSQVIVLYALNLYGAVCQLLCISIKLGQKWKSHKKEYIHQDITHYFPWYKNYSLSEFDHLSGWKGHSGAGGVSIQYFCRINLKTMCLDLQMKFEQKLYILLCPEP